VEQNSFDITHHSRAEDIEVLSLKGYLDAHTAPKLEAEINNLILEGRNNIIISFKDLDYISSAGLGVFMAFIEDVRECGGDIKFCSMMPKVYSVFDLLGFPLIFDIEKDEESTVLKFQNKK